MRQLGIDEAKKADGLQRIKRTNIFTNRHSVAMRVVHMHMFLALCCSLLLRSRRLSFIADSPLQVASRLTKLDRSDPMLASIQVIQIIQSLVSQSSQRAKRTIKTILRSNRDDECRRQPTSSKHRSNRTCSDNADRECYAIWVFVTQKRMLLP